MLRDMKCWDEPRVYDYGDIRYEAPEKPNRTLR